MPPPERTGGAPPPFSRSLRRRPDPRPMGMGAPPSAPGRRQDRREPENDDPSARPGRRVTARRERRGHSRRGEQDSQAETVERGRDPRERSRDPPREGPEQDDGR